MIVHDVVFCSTWGLEWKVESTVCTLCSDESQIEKLGRLCCLLKDADPSSNSVLAHI